MFGRTFLEYAPSGQKERMLKEQKVVFCLFVCFFKSEIFSVLATAGSVRGTFELRKMHACWKSGPRTPGTHGRKGSGEDHVAASRVMLDGTPSKSSSLRSVHKSGTNILMDAVFLKRGIELPLLSFDF